ncbi:2' O-ribose methyltransferase [Rhodotorula kratochvilovae]
MTAALRARPSAAAVQSGKKGASSQVWIQRQRNDPYVRARASSGTNPSTETSTSFVSRGAFKLLELHAGWKGDVKLLRPGMAIVDIGAAPGGWIQAALEILHGRGTVVGVDLLPLQRAIGERDGVRFVQGDFLDPVVQARVRAAVREENGKDEVDLVVSDMMAAMSGNAMRDASLSLSLCEAALAFGVATLSPVPPPSASSPAPAATPPTRTLPVQLVIKHFTSEFTEQFRKDLGRHFRLVRWVKPPSSRKDSKEGFFVCAGFRGRDRKGFEPEKTGAMSEGDVGVATGAKKQSSLYF